MAKKLETVDIWQGTRRVVSMTVSDTDGVVIPLASMTTITLTLSDEKTGAIINSRDAQSILNVNGGAFHATSGLLSIIFTPADNVLVGTKPVERHRALVEFTYASGTKADAYPFAIDVTAVPYA
jgi:hypothetical protein